MSRPLCPDKNSSFLHSGLTSHCKSKAKRKHTFRFFFFFNLTIRFHHRWIQMSLGSSPQCLPLRFASLFLPAMLGPNLPLLHLPKPSINPPFGDAQLLLKLELRAFRASCLAELLNRRNQSWPEARVPIIPKWSNAWAIASANYTDPKPELPCSIM